MNQINEEDSQLFREHIDTIAPNDKDGGVRVHSAEKKPPFYAFSHVLDGTIGGEEVVCYARNGISKKQINIMKQGHIYDDVAEIDLHGYTIEEACEALPDFIYRHQFDRYVRIVHGKGYRSKGGLSKLKTQVVRFLEAHPQVLAFHSCSIKNGGTGAVFALLKKEGGVHES
ncbi:Smr domain protein [hydrothermal vent metagenome]|uniref:Smr domain protein n=1 Tax=hydrothermal vent metagenome TaxID=652676 RepID=A0A1W1E050_9ZZZZ